MGTDAGSTWDAGSTADGPAGSVDASVVSGPGELVCNDAADDDGDTFIDCDDADCDGACSLLVPVIFPVMACQPPRLLLRVPVDGLPAPILDAQDVATTTHFVASTAQAGTVEAAGVLLSLTHSRIGDPWLDVTVPGGQPQRLFQDTMPYQGPMVLDRAILGPFTWNSFNGRPYFSQASSPFSGPYASGFQGAGGPAAGDWKIDITDDGLGETGTLTRAEMILCVDPGP